MNRRPLRLARLRRDRRFVNLGVRGYNTIQSMMLADEWLEREPSVKLLRRLELPGGEG